MEGPSMSKLRAAIFGALLALVPTHSFAQEKVSLAVDWILNGTHAGYFIAQEKGFYKEKGLDVSISRGFGSGDTIKRVATGSVDFGIADTGAVIAARSNDDIPVRIVAMVYDKATLGLIYLKQSGITKPKDLEGRTIARSASRERATASGCLSTCRTFWCMSCCRACASSTVWNNCGSRRRAKPSVRADGAEHAYSRDRSGIAHPELGS